MKVTLLLTALLTLTSALPSQLDTEVSRRDSDISQRSSIDFFDRSKYTELEKRRGGGGGKGGGGSSSGGGGSSSGGGGSSGGGRISSGGSGPGGRPASSYSYSGSSNLGGRTRDGSGSPPSYGGRYAGGAAVPYTAGGRSPTRGVAPYLLGGAAFGFFPGIWLYSVYAYPYGYYGYHYYDNGRNRTANVTCLCQQYSVCGCDPDNGNDTVIAQQLTNGTGSGAPVNSTQVRVIDYGNGNTTAYINGTLENGTTAAGGTDPSNDEEVSAGTKLLINYGGYWVASAFVGLIVLL